MAFAMNADKKTPAADEQAIGVTTVSDERVQNVTTVKTMARSKYFWLPLFTLAALYVLFSDVFYGLRGFPINIDNDYIVLRTIIDLNLFKIVVGIALMSISLDMLQGKGRRLGGFAFLLMALLYTRDDVVPVEINNTMLQLPVRMFYALLFFSFWYILTFYSRDNHVPLKKIMKTWIWMTVLAAGMIAFMVFAADMGARSVTFLEMFGENRTTWHFTIGLACLLIAVTFLWKGVCEGEGMSALYCEVLFWVLFLLPTVISIYAVFGYIPLLQKEPFYPNTRFALECDVFAASAWVLVLFKLMNGYLYKHPHYRIDFGYLPSIMIPQEVMKHVLRAQIWLFIAAVPIFIYRLISAV